jgi:CyaY protein
MDENAFNIVAEQELQAIAQAIDDSGIDCDAEFKASGVLELLFEDGTRMVINRHTAAREIWVAAKSGGFHFRPEGARWVDTRSGRELRTALSELVSACAGEPVSLPPA